MIRGKVDARRVLFRADMEFVKKNLHRRIFRLKILHRQFHLISRVLVRKNTTSEWKWRNLHLWQKFYTSAGSDGSDKFHLCPPPLYGYDQGYDHDIDPDNQDDFVKEWTIANIL